MDIRELKQEIKSYAGTKLKLAGDYKHCRNYLENKKDV